MSFPALVGIAGTAGVGKDTAARYLEYRMRWMQLIVCGMGFMLAKNANAYITCTRTIDSIFSTDDGLLYIYWVEGGMGRIGVNDPDHKATLALATTALTLGNTVEVRYADGSVCSALFQNIDGFLLKR